MTDDALKAERDAPGAFQLESTAGQGSAAAVLVELEAAVEPAAKIPVHISYEIIQLFSEGLYQSPQKAVEELVSNSYDAGATQVHVLLPPTSSEGEAETNPDDGEAEGEDEGDGASDLLEAPTMPLWVIDNGTGMDAAGFAQLWRVAQSMKAAQREVASGRAPIGQFGIGKLAAYVLAWRLTHMSRVDDVIRLTSMNFRLVSGLHQYDNIKPFELDMHELSEEQARALLADVETRDPDAWALLFGPDSASQWTVAGLSDFKDLYSKLSAGRLRWVLRTGLPLQSDFAVWLDGKQLESSKLDKPYIKNIIVGQDDVAAAALRLNTTITDAGAPGVEIPGLSGTVTGTATIYVAKLTEGKAKKWGRSHGFFIRVRGRIINLEDELFGIEALNHASWSRFSMTIDADGLRDHLLSSREGVRSSDAITHLRDYLHAVFNECRRAYDDWHSKNDDGMDITRLLNDAPSAYVTEPIVAGVERILQASDESYYMGRLDIPRDDRAAWLEDFASQVTARPFTDVKWENTGPFDRSIRYDPATRVLTVNTEHPFINKLLSGGRTKAAATLFASSELLVELLLHEHGMDLGSALDFMRDRDRVLRLVAGQEPSSAAEVLRLLKSALDHETALERAVGLAFRALGFEYERRGGNKGGADGVLYARLGRGASTLEDYKVVYDAKQTNAPAVPSTKVDIASLEEFRSSENARYAFFVARAYDAEENEEGKLNRNVRQALGNGVAVTLLTVSHLRQLVIMHYKYGLPLTRLRSLFETANTVPQVNAWLEELEEELKDLAPRVPVARLLERLELLKSDELAIPTVQAVRVADGDLMKFTPEKLIAALKAVEEIIGSRWIEVSGSGEVRLHATAAQITTEVERGLSDLLEGIDPRSAPIVVT